MSRKINIYPDGIGSLAEQELRSRVDAALRMLKMKATVALCYDLAMQTVKGIESLPALEIDGRLIAQGRLAGEREIVRALSSADSNQP